MSKPEHLTEMRFDALDLHESLQRGLADAGFEYASPIQAESLPLALQGKDIAGQAQTGTGKSAAFLLATMQKLLTTEPHEKRPPTDPRCLMLAPTRELAIQIAKDGQQLGKHTGLKINLVYGGTGYESQQRALEGGTDILIGTPGRVIDFMKQGLYTFRGIEVVVLDEADRMFDLGFIDDIRYLLRRMPGPEDRLNMLFSATLSQRVLELAYEHMNDPERVTIETDNVTADNVRQLVYYPANEEKIPLLVHLIRTHAHDRSIVFANTKRVTEKLDDWLNKNGIEAAVISGDVPQNKRERILQRFKDGELPVLIATDVAARGLHIPNVTHVFNFDLPDDAEDYVHRIGRTARAGADGDAISFACENYAMHLPSIEDYIGHRINSERVDHDKLPELIEPPRRQRPQRGGSRGGPGGGPRNRSGGQGGQRRDGGQRRSGGGSGNRGGNGQRQRQGGDQNQSRDSQPREQRQDAQGGNQQGGNKRRRSRNRRGGQGANQQQGGSNRGPKSQNQNQHRNTGGGKPKQGQGKGQQQSQQASQAKPKKKSLWQRLTGRG